ncbi:MAG: DUF1559 domain-containing protein, partial [Lacipirellulaceae bacterium]
TNSDTTLLAKKPLAPASEFDLSYVLSDAAVVIVARPGQVLNSQVMEMAPTEVIQAAMVKETGLDPLKSDQIVISVSPPTNGPPNYTALVRFTEAANLQSEELTRHTVMGEVNGKEYWKSQEFMAPSIIQPDAKSFLLTPDYSMQELTKPVRLNGVGPLAAKVAAATKGDDLFVMINTATLRPLINMGMAQADLPPELEDLRKLPDLISQIELRVNFSNQSLTNFIITANDEDAAEELLAMVESKKEMIRQKAQGEIVRALASDDPVEQAGGRYQQRMLKKMDESIQFAQEGARIILFEVDPSKAGANAQLTYVATTGILVALLLPAVQAAREAARRNQSMNNLKQIMLALLNYEATHGHFPPNAIYNDEGKALLSWRVMILPFLEEQALYDRFYLDEAWDCENNMRLIELMPAVFSEPSAPLDPKEGKTHYLLPVAEDSIFDGSAEGMRLRRITDGLSNTIAVLQVDSTAAVEWTKPADWKMNPQNVLGGLDGAVHPMGFLSAFADGSVQFISSDIDLGMFKAMLTKDGGEVVNR